MTDCTCSCHAWDGIPHRKLCRSCGHKSPERGRSALVPVPSRGVTLQQARWLLLVLVFIVLVSVLSNHYLPVLF